MRIQESDIRLSSRHEQDYRHKIESHGGASFRAVMSEVSETAPSKASGERERLVRMLQSLIDAILASLDGKKCRTEFADVGEPIEKSPSRQAGREMEWHWETTESISEHERTQVEGSGVIKTADGQTIDFSLQMEMCRDYSCERKIAGSGTVVLRDPLVINFAGKAAELTADRIEFDLDEDGKVERLPGLAASSGFLVLDRNHNGRADNGGELFGARSGKGFAELAELDSDGNGWLDEADPGFADLSIWSGGQGRDKLARVTEKGIGAIWLGSADSPFALKDEANRLLGEIRASGIYLGEDGRIGSVQQVDLAEQGSETA